MRVNRKNQHSCVAWFASEQALRGDLDGWLHDHTEQVGDCMEWQFGMANSGVIPSMCLPRALPAIPGVKTRRVAVAKAVWEEANKKRVPPGKSVYRKCQNNRCINPDHLHIGTAKDIGKTRRTLKKAGRTDLDKMRIAHSRRSRSVIDLDIARAIRVELSQVPFGKRQEAYARKAGEVGLSVASVKKIVLGTMWRETQLANPFAGLFAGLSKS